jgi:hypothetical protein
MTTQQQPAPRAPMKHELKTWPEPFTQVRARIKTYEIRVNDRDFRVGDLLWLREWNPSTQRYTGRLVVAPITYMTNGGEWGLPQNLCVLALGPHRLRLP